MVPLIVGMLVCLVAAFAVVGLVAIPARRQGRDMLTPKGDKVVSRVRKKATAAVGSTREKTGRVMGAARGKAGDLGSRDAD